MKAKASLFRFKDILLAVLRHFLLYALHRRAARWPALARLLPGENLPGSTRFRLAIEEVGGTFIKFGQMLAMQSDLLPLEYCDALFSLFDQVPPFPFAEVEKVFLEDLHKTPFEMFDTFDTSPLATGSIGQVHTATLNGIKVAVKIRRPNIVTDFGIDITALKFTLNGIKLFHIRALYWIIPPIEEFIAWTQEELDYRREAHYMEELGRNSSDNVNEKVPAVFWSCTTARILTAEFLEGITVSEYLRQVQAGKSPEVSPDFDASIFAGRLIDNFLGDALRYGMFHADLHPGNLMIMPGNVVGYIDFGISGVLSRYSRRHLISMTLAYARGDIQTLCESFFCITTFDRDADLPGFHHGLKSASEAWYGRDKGKSRLTKSITSIMLELLFLSRENRIWPQRDVIKYIRSAVALDGLIKTMTPGLDIGLQLEQACERHIKRDAIRNLVSTEAMAGWFGANAHLVRDGFLRAFAMLRRSGTGLAPPSLNMQLESRLRSTRRQFKLMKIAWVLLCLAAIWQPQQLASWHYAAPLALIALVGVWQALRHTCGSSPTSAEMQS